LNPGLSADSTEEQYAWAVGFLGKLTQDTCVTTKCESECILSFAGTETCGECVLKNCPDLSSCINCTENDLNGNFSALYDCTVGEEDSLSPGVIAGIVIGVLVGVALIVIGIWWYKHYSKNNYRSKNNFNKPFHDMYQQ
jgi:hypothetical protein